MTERRSTGSKRTTIVWGEKLSYQGAGNYYYRMHREKPGLMATRNRCCGSNDLHLRQIGASEYCAVHTAYYILHTADSTECTTYWRDEGWWKKFTSLTGPLVM